MLQTVEKAAYQSRYGWHACSYKTFLKLRMLHKRWWETRRALARWERWYRKLPKNRVQKKWLRDEKHRKIGFEVVGPLPEPKFCPAFGDRFYKMSFRICGDYQLARMPRPKDKVSQLEMSSEEIDRLYEEVEAWFAEN